MALGNRIELGRDFLEWSIRRLFASRHLRSRQTAPRTSRRRMQIAIQVFCPLYSYKAIQIIKLKSAHVRERISIIVFDPEPLLMAVFA